MDRPVPPAVPGEVAPDIRPGLLRNRITLVWAVLVLATVTSWWLGTDHGFGSGADHTTATITILVIALAKVRFVGLYFMDLRGAPIPLRAGFEAYCLLLCGALIGLYVIH